MKMLSSCHVVSIFVALLMLCTRHELLLPYAPQASPSSNPTSSPSSQPTISPSTATPTQIVICPASYELSQVSTYDAGTEVEVNQVIYRCNDFPWAYYCTQPDFEPKPDDPEDVTWQDAWREIGTCESFWGTFCVVCNVSFFELIFTTSWYKQVRWHRHHLHHQSPPHLLPNHPQAIQLVHQQIDQQR